MGQRFGRHIDESNDLGGKRYTQYTLVSPTAVPCWAVWLPACLPARALAREQAAPRACPHTLLAATSRRPQLIYLSACGGGETKFYGSRNRVLASVVPQPGLALLHKHGDYCLEHEGAAVTAGVKYVLRSDVVFRRHGR